MKLGCYMRKFFIYLFLSFVFSQAFSQSFWINLNLNEDKDVSSIVTNKKDAIFCALNEGKLFRYLWGENNYWELINKWGEISDYHNNNNSIAIDKNGFLYTDIFCGNFPAKSTDMGNTWMFFNNGIIPKSNWDSVAYILGSNHFGDIIAQKMGWQEIYILSTEDNHQWKQISNIENNSIDAKAICFDKYGNLYLACDYIDSYGDSSQIFKYDIHEKQWSRIKNVLKYTYLDQIAVDDYGNIYVIAQYLNEYGSPHYLLKCNHDEENWTKVKHVKPNYVCSGWYIVSGLIVTHENELYIPYPGGLYKCNTSDYFFETFNDGLPDNCIISCMHLSYNGHLYLGTEDGEIYVSREPITGISDNSPDKKDFIVYPNTTNGITKIRYSVKYTHIITLTFMDVLGNREILNREYKYPGDYVEEFDLRNYPQGLYSIILEQGGEIYSGKIVIVK
jgi:hypothetical protein